MGAVKLQRPLLELHTHGRHATLSFTAISAITQIVFREGAVCEVGCSVNTQLGDNVPGLCCAVCWFWWFRLSGSGCRFRSWRSVPSARCPAGCRRSGRSFSLLELRAPSTSTPRATTKPRRTSKIPADTLSKTLRSVLKILHLLHERPSISRYASSITKYSVFYPLVFFQFIFGCSSVFKLTDTRSAGFSRM